MTIYKKYMVEFIMDWRYMIPTVIVTILSFGFTLNNAVIGVDDTAFDLYFDNNLLISQGRFGPALLDKIFHIYTFNPFFLDFCAIICLFVSAIIFCVIFKVSSNNKLHQLSYTIFSCVMISYPLMSEIFCFMTASFTICISFIFISSTLLLMNSFLLTKKFSYIIIATLAIVIVISSYESFTTVYICGVFAFLILNCLYGDFKRQNAKKVFQSGLILAVPLVLGIIIEAIISILVIDILGLSPNLYAADRIYYLSQGFLQTLNFLRDSLIIKYVINGFWYLPISIFVFSVFVALIMMVVFTSKNKNMIFVFLFLGLVFSTILLSIIQGVASPYRTCQVFGFFIAFIMMILAHSALTIKKIPFAKYVIISAIAFLIFFQAQNLHLWFYLDYLRYSEEQNVIYAVSDRLNGDYDITKPVVFTGDIALSSQAFSSIFIPTSGTRLYLANKLMRVLGVDEEIAGTQFVETNVSIFINWGNKNLPPNGSQIIRCFEMNGYYFESPSARMVEESKTYLPSMEEWPSKKSILETEEFIIVNF